jgi:ATP-binding cassette subfamily F protein uup
VLEDFLFNFQGCLLLVSHDRYFMDRLVEHLFVFSEENGTIRDFPGNYTDYREQLREEEAQTAKPAKKASPGKEEKPATTTEDKKRKASYKEKREYEMLASEIDTLEAKKAELTAELNQLSAAANPDHEALTEVSKKLEDISRQIDEKSDRWLELSEIVE